MKAIATRSPGGLDNLVIEDRPDPGEPGPGEIRVALHGSSLNFHDLGVVLGRMGAADGRIPLADGAGEVEAVGPGVTEFAPGDLVVSCFFPDWQDGGPTIGDFSRTPGVHTPRYIRPGRSDVGRCRAKNESPASSTCGGNTLSFRQNSE